MDTQLVNCIEISGKEIFYLDVHTIPVIGDIITFFPVSPHRVKYKVVHREFYSSCLSIGQPSVHSPNIQIFVEKLIEK